MRRRFRRGDRVKITDRLPEMMSYHPGAGMVATVIGSYADLWPEYDPKGRAVHDYCLDIPGHGEVSWYPAEVLTPAPSDPESPGR